MLYCLNMYVSDVNHDPSGRVRLPDQEGNQEHDSTRPLLTKLGPPASLVATASCIVGNLTNSVSHLLSIQTANTLFAGISSSADSSDSVVFFIYMSVRSLSCDGSYDTNLRRA